MYVVSERYLFLSFTHSEYSLVSLAQLITLFRVPHYTTQMLRNTELALCARTQVLFMGGNNYGSAPVKSTTSGQVMIFGMDNYGNIHVHNSDQVILGETVNEGGGVVNLNNVNANLVRVENHGTYEELPFFVLEIFHPHIFLIRSTQYVGRKLHG